MVALPLGEKPQEFLGENPDMVEIAVRDSLRRFLKLSQKLDLRRGVPPRA